MPPRSGLETSLMAEADLLKIERLFLSFPILLKIITWPPPICLIEEGRLSGAFSQVFRYICRVDFYLICSELLFPPLTTN